MITGFNPAVSNNRNQRQNFKALPKDIAKNDPNALKFLNAVKTGKIRLSEEDKLELVSLEQATKDVGIKDYLTETLEFLGVKKPKQ